MENLSLLPSVVQATRKHGEQLNVLMHLPVRLISENNIIDVVPLPKEEVLTLKKRRRPLPHKVYPSLNDLIAFFHGCNPDELMLTPEVVLMYGVSLRTLQYWAEKGLVKRYELSAHLTVYKRQELPSLDDIYGPEIL